MLTYFIKIKRYISSKAITFQDCINVDTMFQRETLLIKSLFQEFNLITW